MEYVLPNENPYQDRFYKLLDRIRSEVNTLRDKIGELEEENHQLKEKLRKIEESPDIFSAKTEAERLALRQKVMGLINKIDHHLKEEE